MVDWVKAGSLLQSKLGSVVYVSIFFFFGSYFIIHTVWCFIFGREEPSFKAVARIWWKQFCLKLPVHPLPCFFSSSYCTWDDGPH